MASTQTIKIKRSTGSAAPTTLASGELAYSKGSDTFYIGDPAAANTPIAVGGAIKNNAGTPVLATGITDVEIQALINLEPGTDVQAYDAGLASIAGLTTVADKLIYTTASDTYATADLTSAGRALLDDANASAQRTTLGLGGLAVLSAVNADTITDNSVGAAELNVTGNGTSGQALVSDGDGTMTWTTISSGGLGNIVEDTTPQLGGMLDVNGNSLGDGTLELLSFSETALAVNEFTIANAATGNGPTLSATGGDANVDINIATKGTGVVKIDNLSLDGNTITTTSGNLTLDSTGGTVAVSDDMTISGDLTVNGTTTTVNTTNTVVSDLLLELGNGTTGTPANDAGIVIERGTANNAFMGFDESADKFIVGTGTFTGASTGDLTITTGTLVANIEGDVTGNVTGTADGLAAGNVTEAALAVATDYMFFFDGGVSGTSAKESVADFVASVAGTNISASSGVMSVATATTSTIGLASFDSTQFDVASGAVTLAEIDGGTY